MHDENEFSTHINGSKRIDFLLASENLKDYITRAGAMNYYERFISDHWAVYCDICNKLFTNITEDAVIKTRHIGTNSTNKEGEKYIIHLNSQLKNHQIFEKMNKLLAEFNLCSKEEDMENGKGQYVDEAAKLDKIFTQSVLVAERQCCKKKEVALWSPTLHQSTLIVQYHNLKMKVQKHKINMNHQLIHIRRLLSSSTIEQMVSFNGTDKEKLKQAYNNHENKAKKHAKLGEE
jgi:hypothetical protein